LAQRHGKEGPAAALVGLVLERNLLLDSGEHFPQSRLAILPTT
jgi:hypothetical protein